MVRVNCESRFRLARVVTAAFDAGRTVVTAFQLCPDPGGRLWTGVRWRLWSVVSRKVLGRSFLRGRVARGGAVRQLGFGRRASGCS